MSKHIILASQSSGRKLVLEKLGIPFEVIVSNFEEDMTLPLTAPDLALYLSKGKAKTLATQYPKSVIIAADTFVVFENKFLGKPKDGEHAREMLKELSGKTHLIVTGFTVCEGEKIISDVVTTSITMKKLSQLEIDVYVATGEPIGKAGSYAIQGKGSELVESIEGDSSSVVGLPLQKLSEVLQNEFGILTKNLKTP